MRGAPPDARIRQSLSAAFALGNALDIFNIKCYLNIFCTLFRINQDFIIYFFNYISKI